MKYLTYNDHLKALGLLDEYENNQLTILRLSYFLNIPFSKVEKMLQRKGYSKSITYKTLVDSDWLPVILKFKSSKRIIVHKRKKSKVKKEIKIGPKPKNKILRLNWEKRKQELKDAEKTPKPIFINTPMGGKVK